MKTNRLFNHRIWTPIVCCSKTYRLKAFTLFAILITMFVPLSVTAATIYAPARAGLSTQESVLYDGCKKQIQEIACGETTQTAFLLQTDARLKFTAEDLKVASICSPSISGKKYVSAEADAALRHTMEYISERVFQALITDCPGELYWLQKEAGLHFNYDYQIGAGIGQDYLIITDVRCAMAVNSDYCRDNAGSQSAMYSLETDITRIQNAQNAFRNARQIVAEAAGLSDRQKLQYYKEKILSLASYEDYPKEDGNAYEMISVFDGNEQTGSVCEGYAKAFAYLCQNTEFQGDVTCLYLTGTLGENYSHAWNVVRIAGENLLVDLTNCDTDGIGEPDLLYLVGTTGGNITTGYTIPLSGENLVYQLTPGLNKLVDTSLLTLSGHVHDKQVTKKNIVTATVNHPDSYTKVTTCRTCGKTLSSTTITGKKLTPTGHWIKTSITMKRGAKKKGVMFIGMAKGDYVSKITSSNTRLLKASSTKSGTVTLRAGKKRGTVYVTIKLHSGRKKKMKVTIK